MTFVEFAKLIPCRQGYFTDAQTRTAMQFIEDKSAVVKVKNANKTSIKEASKLGFRINYPRLGFQLHPMVRVTSTQ